MHPDYRGHAAWVIRDGMPRQARIVGAERDRQPASYLPTALDVLADGESVVIRMAAQAVCCPVCQRGGVHAGRD